MDRKDAIKLPSSPFWEVFKTFGRDEMFAMLVNIGATFLVALLIPLITVNYLLIPIGISSMNFIFVDVIYLKVGAIALAGPIFEKVGFYIGHIKDAIFEYRKRLTNDHTLSYYYKRAVKRGTSSLIKDILIHDPIYVLLMTYGIITLPGLWLTVEQSFGIPGEGVLAVISFVLAVFVVSFIDIAWQELSFKKFVYQLKKKGFGVEKYYEVRFLINKTEDPKIILEKIKDKFNLPQNTVIPYNDYYYNHDLSKFSTRVPKFRIRSRTSCEDGSIMNTIQVVYTKTFEEFSNQLSQYRYFLTKKWKIYKILNNKTLIKSFEEAKKEFKNMDGFLKKRIFSENGKVMFSRDFTNFEDGLFVSVDNVDRDKDNIVVELKVCNDKYLLKEAMEFVMNKFDTIQTTKGKIEMNV